MGNRGGTMGLPEGWYFHTDFPGFARYWDGEEWTAHLRPAEPPAVSQSAPTAPLTASTQSGGNQVPAYMGSPIPTTLIENPRVLILSDQQKMELTLAGSPQFGPAWYPDPLADRAGRSRARYWNGRLWTGRRALIGSAPAEESPVPEQNWRNL
jgi:hypothetical protein